MVPVQARFYNSFVSGRANHFCSALVSIWGNTLVLLPTVNKLLDALPPISFLSRLLFARRITNHTHTHRAHIYRKLTKIRTKGCGRG